MDEKEALKEKVRNVVREVLGEDAAGGGSRPSKFTFQGDTYGAVIGYDEREDRMLLHVRLPERRPVSPGGGIREDVLEIQDYLESGSQIRLVPIPGYYTDEKIVYRIDLDSVLETLIR